ncbi:hypothetical protein ACROYT_G015542 [Oculina patagonica]
MNSGKKENLSKDKKSVLSSNHVLYLALGEDISGRIPTIVPMVISAENMMQAVELTKYFAAQRACYEKGKWPSTSTSVSQSTAASTDISDTSLYMYIKHPSSSAVHQLHFEYLKLLWAAVINSSQFFTSRISDQRRDYKKPNYLCPEMQTTINH